MYYERLCTVRLYWAMFQMQDWLIDLLTCSPTLYHYTGTTWAKDCRLAQMCVWYLSTLRRDDWCFVHLHGVTDCISSRKQSTNGRTAFVVRAEICYSWVTWSEICVMAVSRDHRNVSWRSHVIIEMCHGGVTWSKKCVMAVSRDRRNVSWRCHVIKEMCHGGVTWSKNCVMAVSRDLGCAISLDIFSTRKNDIVK